MSFGGGSGPGGDSGGGGSTSSSSTSTTTTPTSAALPAYTPTHADPSVISAGLSGYNPATGLPQFSTKFASIIGKAGKGGAAGKRSLIGGAW